MKYQKPQLLKKISPVRLRRPGGGGGNSGCGMCKVFK
jgi:hypothetical protein